MSYFPIIRLLVPPSLLGPSYITVASKMHGTSIAVLLNFLVVSTAAKITGSYPVLLTTTSGAPRPSGTGTVLSNYPDCAVSSTSSQGLFVSSDTCDQQICGRNYASLGDRTDIAFDCGPVNRGNISGCEAIVCNDADYLSMNNIFAAVDMNPNSATNDAIAVERLAVDRCGAYYEAQPSASAAASSAIASGTSEALAALATRDPTTLEAYPPCSVGCPPSCMDRLLILRRR